MQIVGFVQAPMGIKRFTWAETAHEFFKWGIDEEQDKEGAGEGSDEDRRVGHIN